MATNIKDYSTTQASNTSLNTINVGEGMLPSNLNNAIRALMKNTRDWFNDAQWIEYGDGSGSYTATYVSGTAFTIDGVDVTSVYHAKRRIQIVDTAATLYGTIASTSFSTNTTVNVTWDSGSLTSGALTSVYLGVLTNTNDSIPTGIDAAKLADGTVSDAEFQYINTLSSNAQTQLDAKAATITGAASTIATSDLTVDRAVISNGSGKIAVSDVTSTELGYLDGVTSAVQTQLGTKLVAASDLSDVASASTARTNLGVAIGSDVQAYDAQLADIAALGVTNSNFIVGDGTNWVAETGSTARTSLGLAIGTNVQAYDAGLADIAGLSTTDSNFIVGSGSSWVAETGSTARTSLGLGTVATQASNSIAITGGSITGMSAPSSGSDVTTKTYVDDLVTGLKTRIIVVAATTANIDLTSDLENGDTLDGVTLVTDEKILVKDQSDDTENGIYVVVASGTASRDPDFDTVAELAGQLVIIQEGTVNADTIYLCTTDNSGSIGSASITFSKVQPQFEGTVTSVAVADAGASEFTVTGSPITASGTINLAVDSIAQSKISGALSFKQEGTNFTDSLLVGHSTTGTLSSASDNTGVGIGALDALTSGTRNTAVGQDAGTAITTATRNVMVGHNAGWQMTTNGSYDNTLIGDSAGAAHTASCIENTLIGKSAGVLMNVGDKNVCLGAYSGQAITHGDRNITIGAYAGDNITTGDGNIMIGSEVDAAAVDSARTCKIVSYDGSSTTNHFISDSSGNVTFAGTATAAGSLLATQGDVTALAVALG